MTKPQLSFFEGHNCLSQDDLTPFDITLLLENGDVREIRAVKRIIFGTLPKPSESLPRFWIDCAGVPADVERIEQIIAQYGYCDVLVKGNFHKAIAYVPPKLKIDDDLIYEDSTRLSYAWNIGYRPTPTRVSRLVLGFGIK